MTASMFASQSQVFINTSVVLVALLFGANLDWPRCIGIGLCLADILLICLMP